MLALTSVPAHAAIPSPAAPMTRVFASALAHFMADPAEAPEFDAPLRMDQVLRLAIARSGCRLA